MSLNAKPSDSPIGDTAETTLITPDRAPEPAMAPQSPAHSPNTSSLSPKLTHEAIPKAAATISSHQGIASNSPIKATSTSPMLPRNATREASNPTLTTTNHALEPLMISEKPTLPTMCIKSSLSHNALPEPANNAVCIPDQTIASQSVAVQVTQGHSGTSLETSSHETVSAAAAATLIASTSVSGQSPASQTLVPANATQVTTLPNAASASCMAGNEASETLEAAQRSTQDVSTTDANINADTWMTDLLQDCLGASAAAQDPAAAGCKPAPASQTEAC